MITQKQQTLQILLKDLEEYEYGNLNLHIRTGSSDIVVCNDNFKEPYWKHLVPGDYWLDLGGYVGSSALVFLRAGAKHVFSVDADPVHVMLYKNNLELNGYDPDILCAAIVGRRTRSIQDFSINVRNSSKLNVAANTLYADKRWKTARPTIPVPVIEFVELCDYVGHRYGDGMWSLKSDIEGAELDILLYCDLSMFSQLFIEYHFEIHKEFSLVRKVVNRLKEAGWNVIHRKIPEDKEICDFWPFFFTIYGTR